MIKLYKLSTLIYIGGLKLLFYKLKDKITGKHDFFVYWRKTIKYADPYNYPRLLKAIFKYNTGKTLNLNYPITFNEKIQWIKLYDNSLIKTKLADKYLVREWIKEKIGKKYLISLIGVWNSFDEIDFDSLPDSFVLKCNHGSEMTYIIKDKNKLDKNIAKTIFDYWMSINYSFNSLELQYFGIPRKIIAEEYIEPQNGNLFDYKIHMFNGVPKIIQVIGDRNLLEHTAKECFFSPEWIPQQMKNHTFETYEIPPERPANLDEMLEISRILSKGFKYVRVDLYNIDGQLKFGEMTFTPVSGFSKWSEDIQNLYGSWIKL